MKIKRVRTNSFETDSVEQDLWEQDQESPNSTLSVDSILVAAAVADSI
jgi:hypothetical protein